MSDEPSPISLARAVAASLGGSEWQLDGEPDDSELPDATPVETPSPVGTPLKPEKPTDSPLPVPGIIEALLFAGGPPLTAARATNGIRGLTENAFREVIDSLAKKYRDQRRPYAIRPRGDGFVMTARPEFRWINDRLHGGPREARIGQAALDVLSLVAYRQPVAKAVLDALRGADAGPPLRQLIRLGLVSVNHSDNNYTTTPRFLDLFGLASIEDLPRIDDTHF